MTIFKDVDFVEKIYFYCIIHPTLKDNNEFKSKGLPKIISLCNASRVYIKDKNGFYTDWFHSSYCQK